MRSYIEELGSLYNTRQYRLGCHLHLYCLFAGGWVVAWERLLVAPLSHLHRYILFAWSVEPSTLMDSLSLSLKFHQLDGPIWTYWLFSPYIVYFSIFSGKLEVRKSGNESCHSITHTKDIDFHQNESRPSNRLPMTFFYPKDINLVWFFPPNTIKEIRFFCFVCSPSVIHCVHTQNQWLLCNQPQRSKTGRETRISWCSFHFWWTRTIPQRRKALTNCLGSFFILSILRLCVGVLYFDVCIYLTLWKCLSLCRKYFIVGSVCWAAVLPSEYIYRKNNSNRQRNVTR